MGDLTRAQLRSGRFRALCHDVYVDSREKLTHELRCEAATLILPPDAVITGRSAAVLRGCELARADDPVEVIAPLRRRITWRDGLDIRRTGVVHQEYEPWRRGKITTPLRMALDLVLDRPLAEAVGDLDAVLKAGLVDREALLDLVANRSDRGIVAAREAVALSNALADSPPESMVRVWLVQAGLYPVPQYWIEDIACVDLGFPDERVAVEYDGQWRDGERWALNRDRRRLNQVQAAGWDVVFVTTELLATPRKLVYTVQGALRAAARRVQLTR